MGLETNRVWWAEEETTAKLNAAKAAYTHLRSHDAREDAYREFLSLYTNRDLRGGAGLHGYTRASTDVRSNKFSRVPFNVTKLMIDTVSARIAKMRPAPWYLTDEGDFGAKRKADRLQKWVEMQFYTTGAYEMGPRIFIDACIYGIGAAKVFRAGEEVKIERVYPGELLVDEHEAFYGPPRQLYQTKYISKDVLKSMFPGHEKEIDVSDHISEKNMDLDMGYAPISSMVEVVEAWHLRSGKNAGDGRRVIFVSGGLLLDEDYPHPDFPFSFVRWMPEPRGFYGIGLAEDLIGVHNDINVVIQKTDRALELATLMQIWVQGGSGVDPKQMTDIPGYITQYRGERPSSFSPPAIPAEVFSYQQQLFSRALQISRLAAGSGGTGVPSGLETGAAIRTFHDIENEPFSLVSRSYESFFMDLARKYTRTGKEISLANPKYTVVLEKDKHTVENVPWADVELDDRKDAFVMKVFPASSLPSTPAGKLSFVGDLLNMQLVEPAQGKALLDFPDLEQHISLDRAASDNIDRIIEKILETDTYEPPEPFMDLQLAMKKAQASVNKAARMGVPEQRVQKLRMFTKQCSDMIKRAEAEAVAMQQMAMMNPAAAPPPDASGQLPGAVTGREL